MVGDDGTLGRRAPARSRAELRLRALEAVAAESAPAASRGRAGGARAGRGGAVPRVRPPAADERARRAAATSPRRCAPTRTCGCGCARSSAPCPARGAGAAPRAARAGAGRAAGAPRGAQAGQRRRAPSRLGRSRTPRTCARRTPGCARCSRALAGRPTNRALAVFGAPAAHEDEPERAVRAALQACELGLAARAGVATGEAIVSGGAATGAVLGTAERLQRAAARGATLADEATVQATRGAVDFESAPPGWSARAAPPGGVRRRARWSGARTNWRRSRPCTPRWWPSAGRTSSRSSGRRASARAGWWTSCWRLDATDRGRCLPYGEGITYWALREILTRAAGIVLGDSAAVAADKLRALVEALRRGRGRARHGRTRRRRGHRRFPGRSAEERVAGVGRGRDLPGLAAPADALAAAPAVVVIEDLHWAETPLLELVEAIVGALRTARCCWSPPPVRSSPRRGPAGATGPGCRRSCCAPLTRRRDARNWSDGLLPARDPELPTAGRAQGRGQPVLRRGARPPRRVRRPGRSIPQHRARAAGRPHRRAAGRSSGASCATPRSSAARSGRRALDVRRASSAPLLRALEERGFVVPRAAVVAARPHGARVRARAHPRGRLPLAPARRPLPRARRRGALDRGPRRRPPRGVRRAARPSLRGGGDARRRGAGVAGRPDEREALRRGRARAGRGRRRRAPADGHRSGAALRRPRARRWRSRRRASGWPRSSCGRRTLRRPPCAATRRSPPTTRRSTLARRLGDHAPPARACARSRCCCACATGARSTDDDWVDRRRPTLADEGLRRRRRRAGDASRRARCGVGRSWGTRELARRTGASTRFADDEARRDAATRGRDRRGDRLLAAAAPSRSRA